MKAERIIQHSSWIPKLKSLLFKSCLLLFFRVILFKSVIRKNSNIQIFYL